MNLPPDAESMHLPADDRIPRVPDSRALFALLLLAWTTATASTVVPLSVGDMTERAYRRGDALAKRRQLIDAWDVYCEGGVSDPVSGEDADL